MSVYTGDSLSPWEKIIQKALEQFSQGVGRVPGVLKGNTVDF